MGTDWELHRLALRVFHHEPLAWEFCLPYKDRDVDIPAFCARCIAYRRTDREFSSHKSRHSQSGRFFAVRIAKFFNKTSLLELIRT